MDEVAYRGSSLDTFDFSGAGTLADSLRSGSGADGVVDGCSLPGTDCWAKLRNAAAKEWELWDCVPGPGPGTACPVVTLGFALPFVETTTFGLFGTLGSDFEPDFLSISLGEQFFFDGFAKKVGGTTLSLLCPLGSLAIVASGLSSGGGGCVIQLYCRLSNGNPHLSYSKL
jgi:hypothetical protein